MNGWGWTVMILWSLLWVGVLSIVIWAAVTWARTGSPRSGAAPPPEKTARELLDERLARGEIELDDYRTRRDALEPHRS